MVGCVIVHEGKVIGEGWHRKYGESHAEVNAVNSVADKSLLKEATIYVSLEPCSIFGNTPPCADLIIRHQIPRVVIATLDDHPKVSGNGVRRLREHGIAVETGVCEEESRELNKYFITYQTKMRPYVHLKWAESQDGYFAPDNGQLWLSNAYSKRLTHKWRRDMDAILVGRRTAEEDNPQLTDRFWSSDHPLRVVIDPGLKLKDRHLFTGEARTLVLNSKESSDHGKVEYLRMDDYPYSPSDILEVLYQRKIMSVLVEGGANTLRAFLNEGVYDEITIFRSADKLKNGIKAPELDSDPQEIIPLSDNQLEMYAPE